MDICHSYRVATLSTLYLNVSGIVICLKWRSGIDKRVTLIFTIYLTAKVITPESLKFIGQW